MITTAEEYFANLHLVQNANKPSYAILPKAERIYNIDVNTRTIEAPKTLGVEKDHQSEVIYFKIDRFVDYMDLAQTCCVIQINNAHNQTRYYPVPFYDIYTLIDENKIIFPWCLDAYVTSYPGSVQFSIRFFKTGETYNKQNEAVPILTYNLSTLPARSTVSSAIPEYVNEEDEYFLTEGEAGRIWEYIFKLPEISQLHWTMLDDSFKSPADSSEIQNELNEILEKTKQS